MSEKKTNGLIMRAVISIAVGAAIAMIPIPAELTNPKGWQLFAVFVSTILAFILQPLPMGAVSCIALAFLALSNIFTIGEALSGFSNATIWLVVSAFIFSRAFITVGLGKRIAYMIIHAIGSSPLKLAYAVSLSDLIIAPATPSNTARGGGIIYPITKSLASTLKSEPGETAKRIGSFLTQSVYHTDTVCSSMFMTATASNTLLAALAVKTIGVDVSWGTWALAALVPGIVCFILVPALIFRLDKPELAATPEAKELARKELDALGKMSRNEKIVGVIFVSMLLLWVTSSLTKINATTVALVGISTLFITGVSTWKDALAENGAWDTLMWMGALVGMATYLDKFGFVPWFAKSVAVYIQGMDWMTALVIIALCYVYTHYFLASMTAHVTALFPAFAAVAVATGTPPSLAVLVLAFCTNISGCLTHYAQGPTPIFFGAGYVDQGTWWKNGFIISVVQLVLWMGIGSVWWKVIGLW